MSLSTLLFGPSLIINIAQLSAQLVIIIIIANSFSRFFRHSKVRIEQLILQTLIRVPENLDIDSFKVFQTPSANLGTLGKHF